MHAYNSNNNNNNNNNNHHHNNHNNHTNKNNNDNNNIYMCVYLCVSLSICVYALNWVCVGAIQLCYIIYHCILSIWYLLIYICYICIMMHLQHLATITTILETCVSVTKYICHIYIWKLYCILFSQPHTCICKLLASLLPYFEVAVRSLWCGWTKISTGKSRRFIRNSRVL